MKPAATNVLGIKKISWIVAYISLILNVYYFSAWMIIASRNNHYESMLQEFTSFVSLGIPLIALSFILLLLSIESIIVFARSETIIPKLLMVLQVFFAFSYVWGNM